MKKKWGALVVLAAILAGGALLWSRYRQGSDVAGEYAMRSFTPAEVREALRSEDISTRLDAVAQLEKLEPRALKAALLEALAASYAPTRLTAVTALARRFPSDPDVVTRLLVTAKEDLDTDVQAAAFAALEKSGDPRVLALACEVLVSTDAGLSLKLQAAETLDRLTGRQTAGPLATAVEDAEVAADEIGMGWEEWIGTNQGGLTWDPEKGRFTPEE
jgi:HEAT repeat protein